MIFFYRWRKNGHIRAQHNRRSYQTEAQLSDQNKCYVTSSLTGALSTTDALNRVLGNVISSKEKPSLEQISQDEIENNF